MPDCRLLAEDLPLKYGQQSVDRLCEPYNFAQEKTRMSVAGISSSSLSSYNLQNVQSRMQQFQQEFQQLGQDLQSGNLSAAQSDFGALQQFAPQGTSSSQSSNPIAQAFNQLSTDLQAGNVTAAQQDYANIQQDFQNQSQAVHHHHHHHAGGGQENSIDQLFQQLGQQLQSGNLSAAQQAYGSLQQELQQFAGVMATPSASSSSSVSVSA
jgi:outer membrane protein assembly factor BamD (BamD/ComL family)